MQPLRTKNNSAISWGNTSRKLSGQNKIKEPLGTKKHKLLEKKKITQPLGTKKNPSISEEEKKTQPLRTKKITQPLGTKKLRNLLGRPIRKSRKSEEVGNRIK